MRDRVRQGIPHRAAQGEGLAELAAEQRREVLHVLDGERPVEPELRAQARDHLGAERAFARGQERRPVGEVNQNEGEGDDREDDGDRGGDTPHEP